MSTPDGTFERPPHGWTCFHCGETFTTPGAARDHFGFDALAVPGCRIKAGEEQGLLMELRRAELRIRHYQTATDYQSGFNDGYARAMREAARWCQNWQDTETNEAGKAAYIDAAIHFRIAATQAEP